MVKKNYDYLLFDLDGTLTDSQHGIIASLKYTLAQAGIEENDEVKMKKFLGPPLRDIFGKYYGMSGECLEQAVATFRRHFAQNGLLDNQVYVGIPQLLADLQHAGYRLAVATSKLESFANTVLDHFQLRHYFAVVGGCDAAGLRSNKAAVIEYVLAQQAVNDLSRVLMIGDREHDVEGAKLNGLACAGVLYGYGSCEELQTAGATYLLDSVTALRKLLLPD